MSPTHAWNQRAREGATTDVLFGQSIDDPFRALETPSPMTNEWIASQSQLTETALANFADPALDARLDESLRIGVISAPQVGGRRVFYMKRDGAAEQAALFMREIERPTGLGGSTGPERPGTSSAAPRVTPRTAGSTETPIVDATTYGPRAAIDWYYVSPRGRYVAFGISQNGDERSTLYLLDVDRLQLRPERIEHTKWTNIAWLNDEQGFYYTRYPAEGEEHYDANAVDTAWPAIYFHSLRDPDARRDVFVMRGDADSDFPEPRIGSDDRYLSLGVMKGWSRQDLHLMDRGARGISGAHGPSDAHPIRPIVVGRQVITRGAVYGDSLVVLTNDGAPRYRFARVHPDHATDPARWETVVPEQVGSVEEWTAMGGAVAVHRTRDAASELSVHSLTDLRGPNATQSITLPTVGAVEGVSASASGVQVAFVFASLVVPPVLYVYDRTTRQLTEIDRVGRGVDTSDYVMSRASVPSADGTMINVHYVHRRDMQPNGQNPVLLTGYGGFNISLLPTFARTALYWLSRGGVYAVANLRGGSEFGEDWHRAGSLANKHHVFEDFEAAIRWFGNGPISSPSRIAITGGSNGGLLIGAMLTRSPELFRVATAYVGLYDMVRYTQFPPAQLWISEYGDPAVERELAWLYEYSPYHRVRDGVAYPATLIETADHDSRVYWGHSTKFAARLQEATTGTAPIYFFRETDVGHGAGTRRSDLLRRSARQFAFVEGMLGMRPARAD